MTGDPIRRELDSVVADLIAPLREGNPAQRGWTLLSWDPEQGLSLTVECQGHELLIELEDRHDERPCYDRTAQFNVYARRLFDREHPLTAPERSAVDEVVGVVRDREGRLASFDRPTVSRRRMVREILVERVLIAEGRGQYYINPYAGCMIGCPFCYVAERADLSRRLEGLPRVPWGHYVDVKVNAPEVLRQEVKTHQPGVVRLSPILTDPYQPLERKYRITRQCLEILLEAGFAPAILTRAARIVEDIPLIQRFDRALVGLTIPTDQDRYRQIFEPGGDPIEDRLDALRACHGAGLTTVAFIQPILPLDINALVERVAPLVSAVRVDRMYAMSRVIETYREHGLEHAATDAFFTQMQQDLERAFEARGVAVDEMDDLSTLF